MISTAYLQHLFEKTLRQKDAYSKESLRKSETARRSYQKYCEKHGGSWPPMDQDLRNWIAWVVEVDIPTRAPMHQMLVFGMTVLLKLDPDVHEENYTIVLKDMRDFLAAHRKSQGCDKHLPFIKAEERYPATDQDVSMLCLWCSTQRGAQFAIGYIALLLYLRGNRVGEILRMPKDYVKVVDGEVVFCPVVTKAGNIGITRPLRVPNHVRDHLSPIWWHRRWLEMRPPSEFYCFPSPENPHAHLHERLIRDLHKIAVKKSGANPRLTLHSYRSGFSIRMQRAGMKDADIRNQLGHSDFRVTKEHYLKHGENFLASQTSIDCEAEAGDIVSVPRLWAERSGQDVQHQDAPEGGASGH